MTAYESSKSAPKVSIDHSRLRWQAGLRVLRAAFFYGIDSGTRFRFAVAVALALLVSILYVLAPILFSSAIDMLAEQHLLSQALALVAGSIAVLGAAKLIAEQRWLVYQPAQNRFLNAIRELYLRHVLSLPITFHTNRSIGRLDSIVGQGMGGLQSLSTTFFTQVTPLIFEFSATTVAILIFLSFDVAAVFAFTIVVYLTILILGAERVSRKFRGALNTSIDAQGHASDAILNAEGVKALAIEEPIISRYEKALDASHKAFHGFYRSRGVFGLVLSGVLITGFAAALGLAATGVISGNLSVGGLVLTNAYLLQLFRSIESFSFSYRDARQSFTAFARFIDLFVEPKEDSSGKLLMPNQVDQITVDNVSFVYPSGRSALKNVSMVIKRGEVTALLGESGSGKSTLVRLMLKLYPTSEGSIVIDGTPISDFETHSLRSQTAIVPQDAVMFKASLAFNVALTETFDQERLRQSLDSARLSNLIQRLPDDVKTEIGERGFKLSGGERQRIAIARALYRIPQILILDEATSALDGKTRDELLGTIRELAHNYATLVITHDPVVADIADHVVHIAPISTSEEMLCVQRNREGLRQVVK